MGPTDDSRSWALGLEPSVACGVARRIAARGVVPNRAGVGRVDDSTSVATHSRIDLAGVTTATIRRRVDHAGVTPVVFTTAVVPVRPIAARIERKLKRSFDVVRPNREPVPEVVGPIVILAVPPQTELHPLVDDRL